MRIIKVKDDFLDLSSLSIWQKKGLFPFLIKAVGFMLALKILFGNKKTDPKQLW